VSVDVTLFFALLAVFDNLGEHVDEFIAGEVALVGGGEGDVTEGRDEDGGRDERGFHLSKEVSEAVRVELLAEIITEEALAGGVDDESGHLSEEVDLAGVALPAGGDELADFGLDGRAEVGELGGGEFSGQEVQLFAHLLVRSTVGDTFTEDGDHEGVDLAGREDFVLVAEEGVVEGRVGNEGDTVTDHVEGEDAGLQLIADLAHKVEGLDAEGDDVADVGNKRLVDGRSFLRLHEVEFDEAKDTIGDGANEEALEDEEEHLFYYYISIIMYICLYMKFLTKRKNYDCDFKKHLLGIEIVRSIQFVI